MELLILGLVGIAGIIAHDYRAHRAWRRSLVESRCRAIGRKLEHRPSTREINDADWARIRRVVSTAPVDYRREVR